MQRRFPPALTSCAGADVQNMARGGVSAQTRIETPRCPQYSASLVSVLPRCLIERLLTPRKGLRHDDLHFHRNYPVPVRELG
jgi:hypothetical protein